MSDKFLMISDILDMNPGDSLKLLCLDRNWMDLAGDNPQNEVMHPTTFFANNYIMIFTKWNSSSDIAGHGVFSRDDANNQMEEFEFHLEDKYGNWDPVRDGRLPNVKHWKDLPRSTLIGWRGPMLKWNDLSSAPMLYYDQSKTLFSVVHALS